MSKLNNYIGGVSYMKQRVLIAGSIFIIMLALSKSGVLNALLIFILVGAIPGTTSSLPAGFMLALCGLVALLVAFRLTAISLLEEMALRRLTRKYIAYRERMPKRRFRHITRPQA